MVNYQPFSVLPKKRDSARYKQRQTETTRHIETDRDTETQRDRQRHRERETLHKITTMSKKKLRYRPIA